jgi:hypothetical protein
VAGGYHGPIHFNDPSEDGLSMISSEDLDRLSFFTSLMHRKNSLLIQSLAAKHSFTYLRAVVREQIETLYRRETLDTNEDLDLICNNS